MSKAARKPNILLVEDDPAIALGLQDALEFEGFAVTKCGSGREGLAQAKELRPSCMILDLMLPDLNGYQICEEIRRRGLHFPIIMLTARGQESDKVRGLDCGADDYVTKPFSVRELVARVRAIFRRTTFAGNEDKEVAPFSIGSTLVVPSKQCLQRGQELEELSFYECEILCLLHQSRGQPVSREDILAKLWGIEANPANRTIDNFIVKLRKKLEPHPNRPRHILTVYGQGYKLVE